MENTEKVVGAKIFKIGDSLAVVIPYRNCKYSGLNVGDVLDIWYRKVEVVVEDDVCP